jgi:hypothetical protein
MGFSKEFAIKEGLRDARGSAGNFTIAVFMGFLEPAP